MELLADLAIVVLFAACLILTVRAERGYWARLLAEREREHRQDVRELLTRIQAPETAPYVLIEPDGRKQYVSEADEDARFEAELNGPA